MAKKKKKKKNHLERFENLSDEQKMEILSSAARLRKAHKMKKNDRGDWKRNLERGRDHSGRKASRMNRQQPDALEDWTRKAMELADSMNTLEKESERELFEGVVKSISRGGGILRGLHGELTFFLKSELAMLQKTGVSVGEEVFYSMKDDGSALVERIAKRKSIFSRPDPLRPNIERVIAVNIDYVCMVASLDSPVFNPFFIDRVMIGARQSGAEFVLCLNKMDLEVSNREAIIDELEYYRGLGVTIFELSAHEESGVDDLKLFLKGKKSVFVGTSGVGKSSLLNAIDSELAIPTQETREKAKGRGRHTTVMSTFHYLEEDDLYIIDTPGFREFNLMEITKDDLKFYFPEFEELNNCKFSDCKHVHEVGCKVLQAREDGLIRERRYESYLRILETLPKSET